MPWQEKSHVVVMVGLAHAHVSNQSLVTVAGWFSFSGVIIMNYTDYDIAYSYTPHGMPAGLRLCTMQSSKYPLIL